MAKLKIILCLDCEAEQVLMRWEKGQTSCPECGSTELLFYHETTKDPSELFAAPVDYRNNEFNGYEETGHIDHPDWKDTPFQHDQLWTEDEENTFD